MKGLIECDVLIWAAQTSIWRWCSRQIDGFTLDVFSNLRLFAPPSRNVVKIELQHKNIGHLDIHLYNVLIFGINSTFHNLQTLQTHFHVQINLINKQRTVFFCNGNCECRFKCDAYVIVETNGLCVFPFVYDD